MGVAVRAAASTSGWSFFVTSASTVPDARQAGWTVVTFHLVVEQTQTGLLSTDPGNTDGTQPGLLSTSSISTFRATWQGNSYAGSFSVPSTVLPQGFGAAAEASVSVPTVALNATTYNLFSPTGQAVEIHGGTLRLHGPFAPLPVLPTTSTHELAIGQTFTVPRLAAMTPVSQAVGPFASADLSPYPTVGVIAPSGSISFFGASGSSSPGYLGGTTSNWLLRISWQNLSGQEEYFPFTLQVMTGDEIIPVSSPTAPLAPLSKAVSIVHLPLLAAGRPDYLLVLRPGYDGVYAAYRFTPPANAEAWIYQSLSNQSGQLGNVDSRTTVAFPDARHGWLVGESTISHTDDGGGTWKLQSLPSDLQGLELSGAAFPDARHGWAVGTDSDSSSVIVHTDDGGATWKTQTLPQGFAASAIVFPDAQHGWALSGNGTIVHTDDGGTTWTTQNAAGASIQSMAFPDAQHGWAIGSIMGQPGTTLLHTDDGGATWNTKIIGGAGVTIVSVTFPDAQHGWAVSDNGGGYGSSSTLLHTDDGGATWKALPESTFQQNGTSDSFQGVVFRSDAEGCALSAPVFCTRDGGATWQPISGLNVSGQPSKGAAFARAGDLWLGSVHLIDVPFGQGPL